VPDNQHKNRWNDGPINGNDNDVDTWVDGYWDTGDVHSHLIGGFRFANGPVGKCVKNNVADFAVPSPRSTSLVFGFFLCWKKR